MISNLFPTSTGTSESQPVFKIHILLTMSFACRTIRHSKPNGSKNMFVIFKIFLFVAVKVDANDTISSNLNSNLSLSKSQLTPNIFFLVFTSMGQLFSVSQIFSCNCPELVNHSHKSNPPSAKNFSNFRKN